jgi:hypothetical protein
VEAGEPKKFGAVSLKDFLRLPDNLDHFVGLVGLEAGELNDRHGATSIVMSTCPRGMYRATFEARNLWSNLDEDLSWST